MAVVVLVIVELDGYQLAQKNLKVARTRKVQSAFIPLIKKVDPPRIDIRADPDQNVFGAMVYLDGQSQGAAPVLLTTTSGRHLVERAPGSGPQHSGERGAQQGQHHLGRGVTEARVELDDPHPP